MFKKSIVLFMLLLMITSLAAVTFADDDAKETDLDDWKKSATDEGVLDKAGTSAANMGLAADKFVNLLARIGISITLSYIGFRYFWGKDAHAKKDNLQMIVQLTIGAIIIFFGTGLLSKFLTLFENAFM